MAQESRSSEPSGVRGLLGRLGVAAAFVWGLAEGTLFFVVPDVVITLPTIYRSDVPCEGHGGILDRIDSICFAAPVFFHLTRYFYTP